MKKNNTRREVLLVTTSSFAKRELCQNDSRTNNSGFVSESEKLEEACWNGLLEDWFQGTMTSSSGGEKLFLWKIHLANTFLCIQLSPTPTVLNDIHSVDPYLFLEVKNYN